MDVEAARMIGAGLATIALFGVGIGIGNIFSNLITTVGRNPSVQQRVFPFAIIGFALLALAVLVTVFPVLIVSPIVIALAWLGIALLIRAFRLKRRVRLRRRKLALRRKLTKIKERERSPGE